MKKTMIAFAAFVLLALALPASTPAHAQDDSAAAQASDAQSNGQDAVNAGSDEQAHSDAGKVFDTPATPPVDTNTPSEGSSGLSNAPTYDPNSGSGLSNAPTPPAQ